MKPWVLSAEKALLQWLCSETPSVETGPYCPYKPFISQQERKYSHDILFSSLSPLFWRKIWLAVDFYSWIKLHWLCPEMPSVETGPNFANFDRTQLVMPVWCQQLNIITTLHARTWHHSTLLTGSETAVAHASVSTWLCGDERCRSWKAIGGLLS